LKILTMRTGGRIYDVTGARGEEEFEEFMGMSKKYAMRCRPV